MPRIEHVVETDYTPSFRADKVAGMFDIPVKDKLRREWVVDLPIEEKPWQIGLITGPSGSGKTTIAHQAFPGKVHGGFEWGAPCVLDDFPEAASAKDITEILSRVGFSSPPNWLLPYSSLSNGQRFRAELARCLFEYDDLVVFDEFTSVVDRQVAQVSSYAFQRAVRKTKRQFVAVTCHYDVEAWLQPDWVLDMASVEYKRGCLQRPGIDVEVRRCSRDAWRLFAHHHYLTGRISPSAQCFVATISSEPVAFCAATKFPYRVGGKKRGGWRTVMGWRGHRLVVLPDYQGLGVGNLLAEEVAELCAAQGGDFFSTTSHPAMVAHATRSPRWEMIRGPSRVGGRRRRQAKGTGFAKSVSETRLTASFRYVPRPRG